MRSSRLGYIAQAMLLLLYSMLVVPLSARDYVSWSDFARSLAIRLFLATAFLALSRRFLAVDEAEIDPLSPHSSHDSAAGTASHELDVWESRPAPRWPFKIRLIPFFCAALFYANLYFNRSRFTPLFESPARVIGLLSEVVASFLLAVLIGMLLYWLALPPRLIRHSLWARMRRLMRWPTAVYSVLLAGSILFWASQSVWWNGAARIDAFWNSASPYAADAICFAFLAALCMPKPGQSRPENLHIASAAGASQKEEIATLPGSGVRP